MKLEGSDLFLYDDRCILGRADFRSLETYIPFCALIREPHYSCNIIRTAVTCVVSQVFVCVVELVLRASTVVACGALTRSIPPVLFRNRVLGRSLGLVAFLGVKFRNETAWVVGRG